MRRLVLPLVLALMAAACADDDASVVETAEVVRSEVVETVAAPAELEPAARVTVTAPAGGDVAELLVSDGDVVEPGDPLVRLDSDPVELQVAQAEAAVDAADALAAAAGAAGVDLSPVLGAFRGQLEAVFPPLLASLRQQLETVTATLEAFDDVDVDAQVIDTARERLDRAEQAYRDARAELRQAESQASSQARRATTGQRAAAESQREQAELALEAARARIDDLTIVAPAGGVVELARASDRGGGAGLSDLEGLTGALDGGDGPAELDSLLGDGRAELAGPLSEGVAVGPGQPLLTIFDLSGFTARVAVDEIDVVKVEVGQPTAVLVDAFPDTELVGAVSYVALSPRRSGTGAAVFPVTVQLVDVPDGVRLRVGLTASAEIAIRRVDAETVVPTSALLRRGEDEVVHVVRDGVVVRVAVDVIAIGDDTAAVDGDLEAGERVVTTGVELVDDGVEVPG